MQQGRKVNIANKLHKQFAHSRSDLLIKLVKDAGVTENEFINSIRSVQSSCDTSQHYKKPAVCPVVGFSLAKDFNETVAMDLKLFKGAHFFTLLMMLLDIVMEI